MIRKLIARIRRKPQAVREGLAFWVAAGFTAVVVMVWAYHIPGRFEKIGNTISENKAETQTASVFNEFQEKLSTVRSMLPEESVDSPEEQVLQEKVREYREQNMVDRSMIATSTLEISTIASSTQSTTSANGVSKNEPKSESIRIITTSQASASSSQDGE